jgi:hypothetical protein
LNTLNVEYRKVEALIPYARNPRTHAEGQIAKIAASIVEYGWTNPILVDGDNGIIAGHGRLAAARKLGLDRVPVIELAHLTVAQKRALVIADNRLALDAGWDEEMLALELAELLDAGCDIALTGFEHFEIDALLADAAATEDSEPQDTEDDESDASDDVPEAPVVPVSRPGDVWQIGAHRLICGDATDATVVAALMQGDTARLCFTSPPYGNQRDYTSGGISDWDGLMRGVFAHLPMTADGQVLVNLGLIHRDNEVIPYWDGWLTGCVARAGGALRGTSGIRGQACPVTGMAGWPELRVRLPLQPRRPQAEQDRALQARGPGIASACRWLVHCDARQGWRSRWLDALPASRRRTPRFRIP